jgi:hypothetical protein
LRRPVFVREADAEVHRALLADVALPLPWPAEPEELSALLLGPPDRQAREDREQHHAGDDALRAGGAPEEIGRETGGEVQAPTGGNAAPGGEGEVHNLEEALLQLLQRSRRKAIGKGALLQMFPCGEAALDRALLALIAAGQVVERPHRAGARYAAVRSGETATAQSGFQLSLFGQKDPN